MAPVDPWACYNIVDAVTEREDMGALAHSIKIQVTAPEQGMVDGDGTRLNNYLTNRLGHDAPGSPSKPSPGKGAEYIQVRVLATPKGTFQLEGMIKGPEASGPVALIPKSTYKGTILIGRPM